MKTKIEWATDVWNPVTGCTKIASGCKHCYAKALHDMRHKAFLEGKKVPQQYAVRFEAVQIHRNRLELPLHWKSPRRIFVNSMSDLFHESLAARPEWSETIVDLWQTMQQTPQHTYMILTKRPEIMEREVNLLIEEAGFPVLPNVWLGTSISNQKEADFNLPFLLRTPAAVHFLSCEPLLGQVEPQLAYFVTSQVNIADSWISWVICGGESGPDARPMHVDWARSLRDQCQAQGVPFFFKQWGEWLPEDQICKPVNAPNSEVINRAAWNVLMRGPDELEDLGHQWEDRSISYRVGKKAAGRLLDGREWNEFPRSEGGNDR